MVQLGLEVLFVVAGVSMVTAAPLESSEEEETSRDRRAVSRFHGLQGTLRRVLCPTVTCRTVPRACRKVENIVFETLYHEEGREVVIRCESCPYCLDPPYYGAPRLRRRSSDAAWDLGPARSCSRILQCPSVVGTCQNVKMAKVLLGGHHCRRCPACYDGTLVNGI